MGRCFVDVDNFKKRKKSARFKFRHTRPKLFSFSSYEKTARLQIGDHEVLAVTFDLAIGSNVRTNEPPQFLTKLEYVLSKKSLLLEVVNAILSPKKAVQV